MSDYNVSVSEFSAKKLVGLKVSTSMQNAQTDCPAIWQKFGLRFGEVGGVNQKSYGVSIMLNESDFDYYAAVELAPDCIVPNDMVIIEIPGGKYAHCTIASLSKLGEGYTFLYGNWPKTQTEYTPNVVAPCFEIYPPNCQLDSPFEINMPVL